MVHSKVQQIKRSKTSLETVVDLVTFHYMVYVAILGISVSTDFSKLFHPRREEKIGQQGYQYICEDPDREKEGDSDEISSH